MNIFVPESYSLGVLVATEAASHMLVDGFSPNIDEIANVINGDISTTCYPSQARRFTRLIDAEEYIDVLREKGHFRSAKLEVVELAAGTQIRSIERM